MLLVATAMGWMMIAARPEVLRHMASAARYGDPHCVQAIAGQFYGGSVRRRPELARALRVDRPL